MRITLDLNGLDTARQIQDYLKAALAFPDYYGGNLDALYDMLSAWDRAAVFTLRLPAAPQGEAAQYLPRLARVFCDAAATNPRVSVQMKGRV
ncbi:MAG: barstar family protein [Clostridia bacterium]|nr:barstar family protein [Clostridia bacterium]